VVRSVALLVSAILLSRPDLDRAAAARYAHALNAAGKGHDFDPLTAVAIIHFETHWRPSLVSPDGEDYGLGQVRARYVGACRDDDDPVGAPSEACKAVKASLLDGENNIRHMAAIISANREFCKERTGTAKPSQWLAGYQGYNDIERSRWCRPGEKTWQVLGYYKEILAALLPKPAAPKPAAPKSVAHVAGGKRDAGKRDRRGGKVAGK
jgi:hypothetical protein